MVICNRKRLFLVSPPIGAGLGSTSNFTWLRAWRTLLKMGHYYSTTVCHYWDTSVKQSVYCSVKFAIAPYLLPAVYLQTVGNDRWPSGQSTLPQCERLWVRIPHQLLPRKGFSPDSNWSFNIGIRQPCSQALPVRLYSDQSEMQRKRGKAWEDLYLALGCLLPSPDLPKWR